MARDGTSSPSRVFRPKDQTFRCTAATKHTFLHYVQLLKLNSNDALGQTPLQEKNGDENKQPARFVSKYC